MEDLATLLRSAASPSWTAVEAEAEVSTPALPPSSQSPCMTLLRRAMDRRTLDRDLVKGSRIYQEARLTTTRGRLLGKLAKNQHEAVSPALTDTKAADRIAYRLVMCPVQRRPISSRDDQATSQVSGNQSFNKSIFRNRAALIVPITVMSDPRSIQMQQRIKRTCLHQHSGATEIKSSNT